VWADLSDRVLFVVAGRAFQLQDAEALLQEPARDG
jgi:hypothetical protein